MRHKEFNEILNEIGEYGVIEQVVHPIAYASGLPGAKIDELIEFETGERGKVLSLEKDRVEIMTFSKTAVKTGIKVTRTDKHLGTIVGEKTLGKIIDPVGNLMFNKDTEWSKDKIREVEQTPPKIDKRVRIDKQLKTGITLVDLLLPLGKGQRELIAGDRKTGKTSIFLSIIRNQIMENSVVVYALIGKRRSEIKSMQENLEKQDLLKNTVVVATSSEDSPSLIDLTPYSAMSIAEYFRDEHQKNSLVILDDLTTHAKFYREISLIGKKFPGRDSYPGDIFYKHARLLERAGNYKINNKEVSITCLPVAETTQGNLTDYIVSNLISITDGHLLLDTETFNKGIRPAINVFLSVTRVGKQTQDKLSRKINQKLLSFLIQYEQAQRFSHFGAELSGEIKNTLTKGNQLYKFLEQKVELSVPIQVQKLGVAMVMSSIFSEENTNLIPEYRNNLIKKYSEKKEVREKVNQLLKVDTFKKLNEIVAENKDWLLTLMNANKKAS